MHLEFASVQWSAGDGEAQVVGVVSGGVGCGFWRVMAQREQVSTAVSSVGWPRGMMVDVNRRRRHDRESKLLAAMSAREFRAMAA